jgi:hypothetical protein
MTTLAALGATARLDLVPDAAADRSEEQDVVTLDELAAMPAGQRITKFRSMADEIFRAAAIGSFVMDRNRAAIVDFLVENPRGFDNARRELAKAAEEARCLLEIIGLADRRLAAGLAVIGNGSAARSPISASAAP